MNTHTIDTSAPVIAADDYDTTAFFTEPDAIATVTNTTAPNAVALPSPDAATAELLAAAQEAGRRAVPAPFAETALVARPLLRRAGLPVPEGPLSYAIAPDLTIRYAHLGRRIGRLLRRGRHPAGHRHPAPRPLGPRRRRRGRPGDRPLRPRLVHPHPGPDRPHPRWQPRRGTPRRPAPRRP
ncbi:hypothetical protein [Streptomyces sp. CBMA152]|uniref:hypothetical protein n=1 Tax=Streptomyces sp. CBMA152 TaxID=1896312 RepID=UPI0016604DCA|nr:hypothetical protein [Streptomyces sp. CBMA152]